MGNTYAYIRISTNDQNEDRQRAALESFNIPEENIYFDIQSGKSFDRPEYMKLMNRLESGDLLILKSIDRLGRDYQEILNEWRVITKEMLVDVKVLDMPLLDTTYCKDLLGTFISDLVLQVLSFSAELERTNLLQRQAEGIAAAKVKGVKFGRKALPLPEDFAELLERWQNGELTAAETAQACGFSVRTLYNRVSTL